MSFRRMQTDEADEHNETAVMHCLGRVSVLGRGKWCKWCTSRYVDCVSEAEQLSGIAIGDLLYLFFAEPVCLC